MSDEKPNRNTLQYMLANTCHVDLKKFLKYAKRSPDYVKTSLQVTKSGQTANYGAKQND